MKKVILLMVLAILAGAPAYSQDLLPLGRDLETFFDELGAETTPLLLQSALEGPGMGRAHFKNNKKWYLSLSVGALLSDGVLQFLDDEEKFELLDINGMTEVALGEGSIYGDARDFFPYPNVRIAFGLKTPGRTETIFLFTIWPQALTDFLAGLADIDDLTFSFLNAGVRIRKPLIRDGGGFPAISLGVGYTFSSFRFGYELPDDFTQDVSGFSLALFGDLLYKTYLHTVGVDLAVSKKLGLFVPFAKVSTYYHFIKYDGGVDDFNATAGGQTYIGQGGTDPLADKTLLDLDVVLAGGFELEFRAFALVFGGSYGVASETLAANIGSRFQF